MTQQIDPTCEPAPDVDTETRRRTLPRALTPFRHRAYRRLAVALVLSSFASGAWTIAQVWEVIRIGGGAAQLSVVATCGAVGVLLPALIGGVVADRVPQKRILQGVAAVPASRASRRACSPSSPRCGPGCRPTRSPTRCATPSPTGPRCWSRPTPGS